MDLFFFFFLNFVFVFTIKYILPCLCHAAVWLSAASDLVTHCLPMPHKKDARLKLVKMDYLSTKLRGVA